MTVPALSDVALRAIDREIAAFAAWRNQETLMRSAALHDAPVGAHQ